MQLRGLGAGTGNRLEISAEGSLHLADLFSKSAKQMGADVVRSGETVEISLIYDSGNPSIEGGQDAPTVKLYWEGWEEYSRLPIDQLQQISQQNLEEAGRTLAMSLMIMGAEREY